MAERAHPEDPGFMDKNGRRNPYRERLFERYAFCNHFVWQKRVADIPCGTGWGTSLLQGYAHAYGIDISAEAIVYAKEHFGREHLKFHQGNMNALPFSANSLDIILCLEGFEHVEATVGAEFLEECKRVLCYGGLLIITCPVLDEYGKDTGNPYHVCEYPEQALFSLLNQHYRFLSAERIKGPDGPEYRFVLQNFQNRRYLRLPK